MSCPVRFLVCFLASIAAFAAATEPRIDSIMPPSLPGWGIPQVKDLDSDGRLDLIMVSENGEGSVWMQNLGNRTFSPAALICRSRIGENQSLVDLDGDGRQDIFSINQVPGSPFQFLPAGSPLNASFFAPHREILSTTPANWWLAADLDGQPGAELIAERPSTSGSAVMQLTLYRRDASGAFVEWAETPLEVPYGQSGDQISGRDADGDGDVDFEINSNSFAFLFERQGQEADGVTPHYVSHQLADREMRWVDLDGDGVLDHCSYLDGTFRYQVSHATPNGLVINPAVEPALPQMNPNLYWTLQTVKTSVNGPALVTFTGEDQSHPTAPRVVYSVRFGDWSHGAIREVQAPDDGGYQPTLTNITDLDGDGFDDVVFMRPQIFPSMGPIIGTRLAVAWGNANGFDAPVWISPKQGKGQKVVAKDFDHDGDVDLIVSADDGSLPTLLLNDGHGNFTQKIVLGSLASPAGFPADTTVSVLGAADLNGDQILDLIVAYSSVSQMKSATIIAKGKADGSYILDIAAPGALDFATDLFSFGGNFADWDGDGDLDLIGSAGWRENIAGQLSDDWHPLLGRMVTLDFLGNPTTLSSFTYGDLDGDGHPDWLSMVYSEPNDAVPPLHEKAAIGFTNSFGAIEQVVTLPVSIAAVDFLGNPVTIGAGWVVDLNEDGANDLLYREAVGADFLGNPITGMRYKINPGGHSRDVANWTTVELPFDPGGDLFWGDFDGDGNSEWCGANGYIKPTPSGPAVSPYYDFVQGINLGQSAKILAMADFDGDGDLDAIWGGSQCDLNLVRNLRVDERSGVSRYLREQGVLGAISNPDEDADGDGRTNAEELLTGSNPLVADAAPLGWLTPRLTTTGGSLQLSWRRRSDAGALGLSYTLEQSNDLKTWSAVDTSSVSWQSGGNTSWQEATVSLPAPAAGKFFRVRGSDGGELH